MNKYFCSVDELEIVMNWKAVEKLNRVMSSLQPWPETVQPESHHQQDPPYDTSRQSMMHHKRASNEHSVFGVEDNNEGTNCSEEITNSMNTPYLNLLNLMGSGQLPASEVGAAWHLDAASTSGGMSASCPDEPLNCTVCGKSFAIRYYLTRHMMSHEEKRFQCPYCSVRVSYKWNLKAHVNKIHRDKPPLY